MTNMEALKILAAGHPNRVADVDRLPRKALPDAERDALLRKLPHGSHGSWERACAMAVWNPEDPEVHNETRLVAAADAATAWSDPTCAEYDWNVVHNRTTLVFRAVNGAADPIAAWRWFWDNRDNRTGPVPQF